MIELPKPFQNEAGVIQNLLEEPCGGVSIIHSKTGARRSSHWHREDAHWLFVYSGVMRYWERAVGSTDDPAYREYRTGDMVYTGPGVEHWTYFPVFTVLLSMSKLPRDHASHESDVVRVPWLPEVGE